VWHTQVGWPGALNKVELGSQASGEKSARKQKFLATFARLQKKRAKLVRLETISQPATRRSKKK
jgi:hypothetical protein